MKKILLFMMLLLSATVFGEKVTNKINFEISPKELRNIVKRKKKFEGLDLNFFFYEIVQEHSQL